MDRRDMVDFSVMAATWQKLCAATDRSIVARHWEDEPAASFAPFDRLEIAVGKAAIIGVMTARAKRWRDVQLVLDPVSTWHDDGALVAVARARLRVTREVGCAERLNFWLMACARQRDEHVRFLNVSEAADAVLPLIIARYQQHGAEPWT